MGKGRVRTGLRVAVWVVGGQADEELRVGRRVVACVIAGAVGFGGGVDGEEAVLCDDGLAVDRRFVREGAQLEYGYVDVGVRLGLCRHGRGSEERGGDDEALELHGG